MIDWNAKLTKAAEDYNAALYRVADLEKKLAEARDTQNRLFGVAQAIQTLYEEDLAAQSIAASENGHGDAEHVAPVAAEAEVEIDPDA